MHLNTPQGKPPVRLSRLPPYLSRWLGYRSSPPEKQSKYIICPWSFIGAFCGLAVLQAIFGHARYFIDLDVPPIVASFGATAVLAYAAIEAPLAQPRALVFGHMIGALAGVGITKLFELLPTKHYQSLEWLVGSLSVAVAIVMMVITETTHPPAGATALIAAVDPKVRDLGWYYLLIILLSSLVVLVTALLFNNFQRRYPVFWFKPAVPAKAQASEAMGGNGEKESFARPPPFQSNRKLSSSEDLESL
ncbi:MAG: hypothetical protein LQ351_002728 [Letrouitia transgressa]|nr:MAG: hypothetical protein LQ351_002728 [Letrouitia transgressa]